MDTTPLKRSLSLPILTLYGIGAILGAGIYVLIGAVAAEAGQYSPLSFLIAAIVAGVTGLSYAELSARMPRSAGVAVYIDSAFNHSLLTKVVGLLVAFTGIVSSATMATGMVGYWQVFSDWPAALIIGSFILAITAIACWGIRESAWLVTLITLIEIAGLCYVVYAGSSHLENVDNFRLHWPEGFSDKAMLGIALGSFLAFYAFLGFEDMVNVAEEVKQPERTMPLAIILALLFPTLLYLAIAMIALAVVPAEQLANHPAPLAEVVKISGYNSQWIAGISLMAIINGALVQMIMSSRVLYGMASMKQLPIWLGHVNPSTSTPINATLICAGIIALLAFYFPLATLAKTTSFIILMIFCLVNLALLKLKKRSQGVPSQSMQVPTFVPVIGLLLCLAMLLIQTASLLA
jgi:amino acid transporter